MKNNNLNILYLGGFELPDKNAAAQRVIANAKLLRSLGHNVVFLGTDKSNHSSDLNSTFKIIKGFNSYSIPYPRTFKHWVKYVTSIGDTLELIKLSALKFDLIITYNFPSLSTYNLIKYCKRKNIKIIADITEWYNHKPNSIMGIIKFLDSEFRMRYFNKKYDGLICISKYLFDYYYNMKNKIQLPPLVDLDDEKWKVEKLPKKDKSTIIYAGSPGNKDKINILIDTMLRIKNIENKLEFRVIGISKDDFFSQFDYNSEQINLINNFVVFLGRIPHLEVIKEVTNADFSAFLRENNKVNNAGFPTKFVESISCGTPVITNKTSNIDDFLISENNGFLVDISDIYVLKNNLEKIIGVSDLDRSTNIRTSKIDNSIFHYSKFSLTINNLLENLG
ncbi:MAG: glycosyltransferase [Candidatus Delongbacteria bacterium]|nr:glycosyltransferase [Candidatus Delongbacteria bacterium]